MNDTKTIEPIKTTRRRRVNPATQSDSTDQQAADEAQQGLSTSSYFVLRSVACEFHEGMLVLRGTVPSFYMKQVAQEIVRKIEGVGAIVNALEVAECVKEHFQEERDVSS